MKEAATELGVAESTIEWHISNVLVKLEAASRSEAVAIAIRDGLLGSHEKSSDTVDEAPGTRATRDRASQDERVFAVDFLGLRLAEIRTAIRSGDLERADAEAEEE